MRYLVVIGETGGTGIRDKYEPVVVDPWDLDISENLRLKIRDWQQRYEYEFYFGFPDREKVKLLDREGEDIALSLKKELVDVKIEYYSDATLKLKLM